MKKFLMFSLVALLIIFFGTPASAVSSKKYTHADYLAAKQQVDASQAAYNAAAEKLAQEETAAKTAETSCYAEFGNLGAKTAALEVELKDLASQRDANYNIEKKKWAALESEKNIYKTQKANLTAEYSKAKDASKNAKTAKEKADAAKRADLLKLELAKADANMNAKDAAIRKEIADLTTARENIKTRYNAKLAEIEAVKNQRKLKEAECKVVKEQHEGQIQALRINVEGLKKQLAAAQLNIANIIRVCPICVNPHLVICGDGEVESSEECDDGNRVSGDGCTSNCRVERPAWFCLRYPQYCPRCGDSIVDPGEECDDGNTNNADACRNNCRRPLCGDGVVDADEECDDGNRNDFDSCRNECTLPICGDGIINSDEQCDDGNEITTDACLNDCTLPACFTESPCNSWTNIAYGPEDGGMAKDIAADNMGNSYMIGWYGPAGSQPIIWMAKFDRDGTEVYNRYYSGSGGSGHGHFGEAIKLGQDGYLYLAGSKVNSGTDRDIWIAKMDPTTGILEWEVNIDGPASSSDEVFDIALDNDGYVYATGYMVKEFVECSDRDMMLGRCFSDSYKSDIWIGKLNSDDGSLVIQTVYNHPDYDVFRSSPSLSTGRAITLDVAEGSLYITGREGYSVSIVHKYSLTDLTPIWDNAIIGRPGTGYPFEGLAISLVGDDLLVGGGTADLHMESSDAWLGSFNPTDGTLLSDAITINGPGGREDRIYDILSISGWDKFYVSGIRSMLPLLSHGRGDVWIGVFSQPDIVEILSDTYNGISESAPSFLVESDVSHAIDMDVCGNVYTAGAVREARDPGLPMGLIYKAFTRKYCSSELDE